MVTIKRGVNMPRALTEQEKCVQCQRLLEKGKSVVLAQGIKKISVDEITKAADMAKGTFYQHFETKEQFLFKLVEYIHGQIFTQVEQMILSEPDLKKNARTFFTNLFCMPEMAFFTQNEQAINEIFWVIMPKGELQSFKQMEEALFEKMLVLAGADTKKVKPGVIHNYVHTLYLLMGSDLMIKEDLPGTFECIIGSLISYIYGVV